MPSMDDLGVCRVSCAIKKHRGQGTPSKMSRKPIGWLASSCRQAFWLAQAPTYLRAAASECREVHNVVGSEHGHRDCRGEL